MKPLQHRTIKFLHEHPGSLTHHEPCSNTQINYLGESNTNIYCYEEEMAVVAIQIIAILW